MENSEKLKNARNIMLKLHKSLLDRERQIYEGIHGRLNATQFLSLLLDDQDFSWLRKLSMLIVEIDEMFAQRDGIEKTMVEANLLKATALVRMSGFDESFEVKYRNAIEHDADAAGFHSELKTLLA